MLARRREIARALRASGPLTTRQLAVMLGGVSTSVVNTLLHYPWFRNAGHRRNTQGVRVPLHELTEAAGEAFA